MPGRKSDPQYAVELQAKYSRLTRAQVKDLKERFRNDVFGTLPVVLDGRPVKQRAAVKQSPWPVPPQRRPAPRGAAKTQKKK